MEMLRFPSSTISSEELSEDNEEESRTLWVGNIEEEVDDEILYELFLNSGPVTKVTIPRNKQSNQSKGFAFILFEHRESVPYAIQQMSGTALYGRTIVLKPHSRTSIKKEMSFTSYNWEITGVAETLREINQNDPKGTFEWKGSQYSNVKVKRTHDYSFNDISVVTNQNAETSRDNQERSRERLRRGERSEYEYMRSSRSQQFDLRDKVNRRKMEDKYSYEMSRSREKDDLNSRSRDKYYESSSRNARSHERQKRDRSRSRRNHNESSEKDESSTRERYRSRRNHNESSEKDESSTRERYRSRIYRNESSEKDESSTRERYRSRRYRQSSRDDVGRSDTAFRDRSQRRLNRSKEREYSHNMSPVESSYEGERKSRRRKYLRDRSVSSSPDGRRMDQKRNKYYDQGRD